MDIELAKSGAKPGLFDLGYNVFLKRQAYILHLEKFIEDAKKELNDALDALQNATKTGGEIAPRFEKVKDARDKLKRAEDARREEVERQNKGKRKSEGEKGIKSVIPDLQFNTVPT